MANKGISEIPLFDPIFQKMDCPLFGVTTVFIRFPYLKNFDEIPQKSPKSRTEIGFSDHIR